MNTARECYRLIAADPHQFFLLLAELFTWRTA